MGRKKKSRRDDEHIRKYPQFQKMEKWVIEGEDQSLFAHFGRVIKKTAVRRKRHPGHDTVSLVRKVFQGSRDNEIVIMEEGKAWKIEVVEHDVPRDFSGPIAELREQALEELAAQAQELKMGYDEEPVTPQKPVKPKKAKGAVKYGFKKG